MQPETAQQIHNSTTQPSNMKSKLKFLPVIFVIISLLSLNLDAQTPFEGSVRYLRTSNWVKMWQSLDYISQSTKERSSYVWGNRSEWKSYMLLHCKAEESLYLISEEEAEPDEYNWAGRNKTYFMQHRFGMQKYYYAINQMGQTYLIQDSLIPPKWKILNDMKEVAGHVCMSATYNDTLRNQTVLAWFALDIPIPSGPDHFVGLPGLILEVNINNGALVLTADKIDPKPLITELELPKKIKGKPISPTDYRTLIKEKIDEEKAVEGAWFWRIRYEF